MLLRNKDTGHYAPVAELKNDECIYIVKQDNFPMIICRDDIFMLNGEGVFSDLLALFNFA